MGFAEEDINDDFDPECYDKRMSKVFGDDYYGQDEAGKPIFPSDEGTCILKMILCTTSLLYQELYSNNLECILQKYI